MPSWFSKVFRNTVPEASPAPRTAGLEPEESWSDEDEPPPRRTVHAPVLLDEEMSQSDNIRIKARLARGGDGCTFLVDRHVLAGHSLVCPDRDTAEARAPLAAALFALGGVSRVTLHNMTVSVWGDRSDEVAWAAYAKKGGRIIREYLRDGKTVVLPQILAEIPSEEEIRWTLQRVIENEINPGIAAHSGRIVLNRVEGNTVYITMGGGCQGCAMSSLTLRQGVERAFRDAVPGLGAVLDETDHAAGMNPYFKEAPAGLE